MTTLRLSPLHAALLLSGLALAGCPSGDGKDDTADTDTGGDDTDTGGETDTDTGGDSDTDTGGGGTTYTGFTGTSTLTTEINGEASCNVTASLTGTPYTGDCFDCTFAFDLATEITDDQSADSCDFYYSQYSFIPYGEFNNFRLIFWEDYYGYSNVQFNYYGYGEAYPGPYPVLFGYDGGYYYPGRSSLSGMDFSATWDASSYGLHYYAACDALVVSDATSGFGGMSYGPEELDCDALLADVWTFETDGGTVGITVDTVSDATAFDTRFLVNSADGCSIGYSDDNWACSYPPPTYQCPAIELTDLAAGTYTVVVHSYGDCAGSVGEYTLSIDGATSVELTADDANQYDVTDIHVNMSATLSE